MSPEPLLEDDGELVRILIAGRGECAQTWGGRRKLESACIVQKRWSRVEGRHQEVRLGSEQRPDHQGLCVLSKRICVHQCAATEKIPAGDWYGQICILE